MAVLKWDEIGDRLYETGTDLGVFFVYDADAETPGYKTGVPWNGLTAVKQTPKGGEFTPQYADNIKYLNLASNENFEGTIEAFTYPSAFYACEGNVQFATAGAYASQQPRSMFGLSYRTLIGNDTEGDAHGFKIHLVWGANATPSEKSHETVNESPNPVKFSWNFSTTPVVVPGFVKPIAHVELSSLVLSEEKMLLVIKKLWGDTETQPTLPSPSELAALIV